MRAHHVIDSAAVRYEADSVHDRHEVVQHTLHGAPHLRQQQTFDNPVRVPVIELAESAARYDHRIRNVNDGVKLLVVSHVVLHLSAQHLPDVIEIRAELSQLVVLDLLQELGIRLPVGRIPVLELVAGRLERVVDKLLHFRLRRFLLESLHEDAKRRQRLVRRPLHFHVDELLRVLVHAGHLYRVQQIAVAVYLTGKAR